MLWTVEATAFCGRAGAEALAAAGIVDSFDFCKEGALGAVVERGVGAGAEGAALFVLRDMIVGAVAAIFGPDAATAAVGEGFVCNATGTSCVVCGAC